MFIYEVIYGIIEDKWKHMSSNPLTIGSDPEFLLVEIRASGEQHLLPAYSIALARTNFSQIGCDGNTTLGELRPKPSKDPIAHFKNIKALITISRRRYLRDTWHRKFGNSTALEMRAGSTGSLSNPLGGHIHFGIHSTEKIKIGLDRYLSIPLLFIEQKPYNQRRRTRYGRLATHYSDSMRSQYHGFEYRTPSSWIIEPEITLGVLTLAYTIVSEAIHHPENIRAVEISDLSFNSADTAHFKSYLPSIFQEIRQMELYKKYKKPIEKILKRVKAQKTWDETSDVWKNWIPPKVFKRQATLPKHHLFTFTTDEFLSSIAREVNNPLTSEPAIRVFGLNSNRNFTTSTNNEDARRVLHEKGFSQISSMGFFGGEKQVGFRLDIRSTEAGRRKIIEVLNEIARRCE